MIGVHRGPLPRVIDAAPLCCGAARLRTTRVETTRRIRRAHCVQSLSIREIARRVRMRKTIEAPEGAFAYSFGPDIISGPKL